MRRSHAFASVACSLVALILVIVPGLVRRAAAETFPDVGVVPLDSTVDVRTLSGPGPGDSGIRIKPFRTPDPEGLRQWKQMLSDVPGALSPGRHQVQDQTTVTSPAPMAPTVQLVMNGLSNADNVSVAGTPVLPSDSNLGVGPAHVFETVNVVGRITPKAGGTPTTFTLHSFFGVDPGFQESDPRIIYDAQAGRWFGTFLEYSTSQSSIILLVSATSDPTGVFCRYRLGNPATETFLQDFPMIGVSDDKVVVSYNGFSFATSAFLGGGFYVVNKADLTGCASGLHVVRVAPMSALVTPHPAQSLSSTSDLYMPMHASPSSLALLTVKGIPGVSTVSVAVTTLAIEAWNPPPSAQQSGSSQLLDTGDDRIISAAWWNNALWLSGNEACTPLGDTSARSCLRIIEIRTDTLTVAQEITFDAAGAYYFYPAVRPDSSGNLHVVFGASSASMFASVWATGRLSTDPVNTLQSSTEIQAGGGAQTDTSGRMGDYSGAAVDPSNPALVWVTSEYIASTGDSNWGTVIAQLQFTGGTALPDLVTTAVTNPPPTAAPGSSFSVTDTVENSGTAAAGPSTSRYYLSLDTVKSASDVLLSGSRSVPSLAPGASSTGTVSVTVPASMPSGTYYLLACANDTGTVTESNTANNCLASATTVQVGAADLVETALSNPPASASVGTSFTATDTVQNIGTLPAGASTTDYYLVVAPSRTATHYQLNGSRSVPPLAHSASSTGSATVTIAAGTPSGTYYFAACANDTNTVAESNVTNNCRVASTLVTVGP